MEQAPVLDSLPLDALAFEQDGLALAGIGLCGCQVFQAFVVSPRVVLFDEHLDLQGEVAGQIIVL